MVSATFPRFSRLSFSRRTASIMALALALLSCGGGGSSEGEAPAAVAVTAAAPLPAGISLLAGGLGGSGTLDATGPAARFNLPGWLALGPDGSLYLADIQNHTVRKISSTGVVTTLAGKPGVSGVADGNGAMARFNGPVALAVAADHTVYVTDSGSHTIRKIMPDGEVTTLAGMASIAGSTDGAGAAARFSNPTGIVVTVDGTLYVADSGNHTIRQVTAAGDVTTRAGAAGLIGASNGTGAVARFYTPTGLALDSAGVLYVADSQNNLIRKVAVDGEVTTLAGAAGVVGTADGDGAAARFNIPYGVAVGADDEVYVTDTFSHAIRKITPTGTVSTLAGLPGTSGFANGAGSLARFNSPVGIVVTATGKLYVADTYNHEVRQITAAGIVSAFAGTGVTLGSAEGSGAAARFHSPGGIGVGSDGTVYVADTLNHTLRQITPAGDTSILAGQAGTTGTLNGTGAAARFSRPSDIVVDAAGTLYVSDTDNHIIRKVTVAGEVSLLAGQVGNPGSANGAGASARFNGPQGLAMSPAGMLYVADSGNHLIRKITPAGVVTTLAGLAGASGTQNGDGASARFSSPYDVAVSRDGIVYVSDQGNHVIRKITATGTVSTLAGAFGSAGSVDGDAGAARFNAPAGLAVDVDGNVYVSDRGNSLLRKITPAGEVSTIVGTPGSAGVLLGDLPGSLSAPSGIAIGMEGELYVSDENSVLRVTLPVPINVFGVNIWASASSIMLGQSAVLGWSATGASACNASGEWSGSKGSTGSQSVTPATGGTLTYTLTCDDLPATSSQSASIDVVVTYPVPVISFTSSESAVTPGQDVTLTWSATGATSCNAGGAWSGSQAISGSLVSTPAAGINTYSLTCTGPGGTTTRSVSVSMGNRPSVELRVSAETIRQGQSVTVSWVSTDATSCTTSGNWFGAVATNGSMTLTPGAIGIQTYILTCVGLGGQTVVSVTADVQEATAASVGGASGGGVAGWEVLLGVGLLGLRRRGFRRRACAGEAGGI